MMRRVSGETPLASSTCSLSMFAARFCFLFAAACCNYRTCHTLHTPHTVYTVQCTVYSVCPKSVACHCCHCCSLNLRSLCKMKWLTLAATSTATATAMPMHLATAANAAGYALQTHKITVIVVVFALQCTVRCCHTSPRPSVPAVYYIYSSGQQQQEKPWNLS